MPAGALPHVYAVACSHCGVLCYAACHLLRAVRDHLELTIAFGFASSFFMAFAFAFGRSMAMGARHLHFGTNWVSHFPE